MKAVLRHLSILVTAVLLLSGILRFHHHDAEGRSHSIVTEMIHTALNITPENTEPDECHHHHYGASHCGGDCNLTLELIDSLAHSLGFGLMPVTSLSLDVNMAVHPGSHHFPERAALYCGNIHSKHITRRGPPCFIS